MENTQNKTTAAMPRRVEIREGDIVVPYQRGYPIMLFDNMAENQQDPFIRARVASDQKTWCSDVDLAAPNGEATPRDPQHTKSSGIVVFVSAQSVPTGFGVCITRVSQSGGSARGSLVPLPKTIVHPFDADLDKLVTSGKARRS